MLHELQQLACFSYFKEICAIPRESGNEKAISEYLMAFAARHSLTCHRDAYFNVVIEKPASAERANAPPVFLQAHIDMVCEKIPGSLHNFRTDGIEIFQDGDFIHAKETSLGSDNGIGMAMLLQILEDEFEHPAISAIFTADEERGLVGVKNLDISPYQGNMLINLDGEAEGVFLVSCAGGVRCAINLPIKKENYVKTDTHKELLITVTGLKGGHSGLEIDKEQANAILILERVLRRLIKTHNIYLLDISGGNKENSIPSMAQAIIGCGRESEQEIKNLIEAKKEEILAEYAASDPDIHINVGATDTSCNTVVSPQSLNNLLSVLLLLPNGLIKRDLINGSSLTSSNIGVMKLHNDTVLISAMIRSNVDSIKYHVARQFNSLADITGAKIELQNDYPAWEYNSDSNLRTHFENVYEAEFGHKPNIQSIHGGLECAYFAQKRKNMDMISIGCNLFDVHSVRERFSISSAVRTYGFLKSALMSLK
jgi:dipeptidase D